MTYQQAGRIAVIKRILGWVIFIPAVLSTLISVLKFMYEHSEKKPGIDAVMMDFAHVMIEMMRFNTPFLNFFWYNSPLPDFHHSLNIGFWIIFILVFVGMALQASGARMARQAQFLREGIEDQLILEQAKGAEGLSREQLAERIVVPRHTILVQYFPLYVLPVIVIIIGYFFFSLLGFL
ncbi:YniB family protein [Klebsiella variicola]